MTNPVLCTGSKYFSKVGKCPSNLIAPLIKIVIEEIRKACKKQPINCGFNPADNAYEPLKLMQTVMAKTNEVCLRYLDNSMLCSLPAPGTPFYITSVFAMRNSRKKMEDRHVVIHDLNTMFNIQEASPSSYYAVFDGHAGQDAAAYSAAHLHQFLAENKHFVSNPEQALMDAFCKTDALFIEKCKVENLSSGTTAVVALLRPKENTLYVAWAGDSQALLVKQGRVLQVVNPHKPCRQDEKDRIEKDGGCVMLWGTWRVNGQLAVSRAIGDAEYKPYVIAIPEIREINLDGREDFLIIACDGLWDYLSEDCAAATVYRLISENPDDTDRISQQLAHLSKQQGSTDNISAIVVFLREPSKIAAEACWNDRPENDMEASLDRPFAGQNGSAASDGDVVGQQKSPADGLMLNLTDNFKRNGSDAFFEKLDQQQPQNGNKRHTPGAFDDDEDDDFGPETDIDALDELPSPSEARRFADELDEGVYNPFVEHQEKAALEMERQLKSSFEEEEEEQTAREEAPTPPVDAVHDVSGLVDNTAESDSEDEWNYIKGEEANKENDSPQPDKKVAEIPEEEDAMSQLNPNAAEFVPVSPTRSVDSPTLCRLMEDAVIAQSPKRPPPAPVDLSLPADRSEFEREAKARPSEVDAYSNGHADGAEDGDRKTPTDLMESILNGKSIDDIPEFHPGSTPKKNNQNDEFHFGPNAAPFTPVRPLDQSEAALSTRAVFGDESVATLGTSYNESAVQDDFERPPEKESDPMSMSFYADKGSNPFDLNKVHLLPENLDEFLQQPDNEPLLDDTISDLPEHEPLKDFLANNDDAIQTTDLDKQAYDDEKELASPLEPEKEFSDSDVHPLEPEKELTDSERDPLESEKDISESHDNQESVLIHRELDIEEDLGIGVEERDFAETPEPTRENLLADQFCHVETSKTSQGIDILPVDVELTPEFKQEVDSLAAEVELLTMNDKSATEDVELSKSECDDVARDVEMITPEPELVKEEPKHTLSDEPEKPQATEVDDLLSQPEATEFTDLLGQPEATEVNDLLGQPEEANLLSQTEEASMLSQPEEVEMLGQPEEVNMLGQPEEVNMLGQPEEGNMLGQPEEVNMVGQPEEVNMLGQPEEVNMLGQPEEVNMLGQPEEVNMSGQPEEVNLLGQPEVSEHVNLAYDALIVPESETVAPEVSSDRAPTPDFTATELIEEAQKHFDDLSRPEEEFTHDEVKEKESVTEVEDSFVADQSTLICGLVGSSPVDRSEVGSPKDGESVTTADVNSFLNRSMPPDVESPLSVSGASENRREDELKDFDYMNHPLSRCVYPLPPQYSNQEVDVTADNVSAEFAEATVVSPCEDSDNKQEEMRAVDECSVMPELIPCEAAVESKEGGELTQNESTAVGVAAVVATGAAIAAMATAVATEEKPKPSSAKKTVKNGAPTSANKLSAKAAPAMTKTSASRVSPRPAATKTGSTKPPTAAAATKTAAPKPISKPKTTLPPKSTEKKPLANGDVKSTVRSTLAAKKTSSETTTAPKTSNSARLASTTAPKLSPTKPAPPKPTAAPRTASAASSRPASARPASATAAKAAPRPTTLTSRPLSGVSPIKSASATTKAPISKTSSTTAAPKPKAAATNATTAPSRPRPPASRTVAKAADAEKQSKESANKITASRNVAARTASAASARTTTTVRRVESKTATTRTTVSKSSVTATTKSAVGKKPAEIVRTKATKIEKPKQNGTAATVIEAISIVSDGGAPMDVEPALLKDNSPVDNKLMTETAVVD